MQNPVVDIVTGVAPVSIRWETETGFFRQVREPGADLADLPQPLRAQIEAHWTPELVAAWQAALADLVEEPVETLPALTPRQIRLMMLQIGVSESAVEAAIAAIEDPVDRAAAQIEWSWATRYERDHPLVVQLAAALEFEPGELDALWEYAAGL